MSFDLKKKFSNVKKKEFICVSSVQNVPDSDILYLASPNGIDGQLIDAGIVKRIAHNYKVVIVDEAYYDWHDEKTMYDIADNVVVLRTLSKSLGQAGLRFSYAIGNENIINFLQMHRPSCASHSFMMPILEQLLDSISGHVDRMKKVKFYLEKEYKCSPTNANFVIFEQLPNNINLVKTKGNRMALCDMGIAQCLK